MENNSLPSFDVSKMDLSGVDNEELQQTVTSQVRYLKKPGSYDLKIISAKLYTPENKKDKAGKQWGSIHLIAENADGYRVSDFVDVPIEALLYTGNGGKTSAVKTRIFSALIQAVTGEAVLTENIPNIVQNLSGILTEGAMFRASLKYRGDVVRGHRAEGADSSTFTIELASGGEMLDSDGNVARFDQFNDAVEYYRSIKNFSPATGLSYTGFYQVEGN